MQQIDILIYLREPGERLLDKWKSLSVPRAHEEIVIEDEVYYVHRVRWITGFVVQVLVRK